MAAKKCLTAFVQNFSNWQDDRDFDLVVGLRSLVYWVMPRLICVTQDERGSRSRTPYTESYFNLSWGAIQRVIILTPRYFRLMVLKQRAMGPR